MPDDWLLWSVLSLAIVAILFEDEIVAFIRSLRG